MSSDACATRQGFSSSRTFLRVCSVRHFALCGTAPGIFFWGGRRAGKIFRPRGISGGVNSTGQRLQQEGQRPLGGGGGQGHGL